MSQSDIIKVLFNMGVTDDRSTSVTPREIKRVVGEDPLSPSMRRGLYKLTKSGEVILEWDERYLWGCYYYFSPRLYKILKAQMSDKDIDLSYKMSDKTAEMPDKCPTKRTKCPTIIPGFTRQIGEIYARNRENIC